MKILVFGSLNIDLTFSVDHIVEPGETISGGALVKGAGGKGANQAAALAKAGLPVWMAGKIGGDGQFLLTLLESYGVHTEYVARYEGETGQAIIQLDARGQNAIILYTGGNGAITPEEIDRVLAAFNQDDILVFQNETSHIKEIAAGAKNRGLKTYLNPSPYNQKIEELPLDMIDLFFVNELEGAALVNMTPDSPAPLVLDRLVKRFPRSEIVLTLGKEGAYYGFRDIREKGDIVDVPVADTTGAGDTFIGYFTAARYKGFSVKKALGLACKASSIAVSRKGAMEAIPFAGEVFEA
ncbi:MAG: ribokinase [Spirochaetaceae bacterium]|jgi:ribokinase|nr:ribokinase [Spirochaetaceae bacterium]